MLSGNRKKDKEFMRKFFKCRFLKAKAKGNIWSSNLCISVCMLIKKQKAKKFKWC